MLFTVVGQLTYRRAYYLCDTCHQGTYPRDGRLGLRPGELSADLESLSTRTGVPMPFGQESDFFERLTLVGLSPQSIDTVTQALGREMEQVETEWKALGQNLTYFCDLPVARELGELVWTTRVQRHAMRAHELIFVGGGAEWLWVVECYTVNKMYGGSLRCGSARTPMNKAPARKGGQKDGAASADRPASARSPSAPKAARTRTRRRS